MIKSLLAAAAISIAAASSAAAAPIAPSPDLGVQGAAPVIQVQHRGDRHDRWDRHDRRDRRHYVPGHRYDRAPSHWRRYHSRPHDWRRRGCVVVGPVWFCP